MPSNRTVEATGPSGALVDYTPPKARDLVDIFSPVICTPVPGITFAVGTTVTVPLTDADGHGVTDRVAAAGGRVLAVATRPSTLDDVYLMLTGDRLAA